MEVNLTHVQLERAYLVNVVRDITERKRVEESLVQKSEQLTEAQHLAGLGSWQWDAQSDTVTWSIRASPAAWP